MPIPVLVGPGNATARPNLGLMLSHSGLREPVSQNLSWWRYEHGAIEWFNQMGTCMGERKNGGGERERERKTEKDSEPRSHVVSPDSYSQLLSATNLCTMRTPAAHHSALGRAQKSGGGVR